MKQLENAVFVKFREQRDKNKIWLCHLRSIRPEDSLILDYINKKDDFYGCECLVKTRKGYKKGYIVSNILKLSPKKMESLAKDLGGYYPLASIAEVNINIPEGLFISKVPC